MAKVFLICGKICSGKSYYAEELKNKENAVILSTDEVTYDLTNNEQGDNYDAFAIRVNNYLRKKAAEIVKAGCNVILDWGFWTKENRREITEFFEEQNIEVEWHYIDVEEKTWKKNIEERNRKVLDGGGGFSFYVDEGLFNKIISMFEEPTEDEMDIVYNLDRVNMVEDEIPELNIFMMCDKLDEKALSSLPKGFYFRTCRKEELDIWKQFPFDKEEDKREYKSFMTEYFENVYAPYGDLFFDRCLFVCDENDKPVATCFAWKAYDEFYTIHWLKVLKEYENKGLGRAILSEVMKNIDNNNYPIYLHTQPGSFRAIKLYSDFGFSILTDEYVGNRKNEYEESLEYLKYFMKDKFNRLSFKESDGRFSEEAKKSKISQF